jgi:lysozyme family protein
MKGTIEEIIIKNYWPEESSENLPKIVAYLACLWN